MASSEWKEQSTRSRVVARLTTYHSRFLLFSPSCDIGHREKAQQHQRLLAGVARHVLLSGRNKDGVTRFQGMLPAVRFGAALARQDVDALLKTLVKMRAARHITGLHH